MEKLAGVPLEHSPGVLKLRPQNVGPVRVGRRNPQRRSVEHRRSRADAEPLKSLCFGEQTRQIIGVGRQRRIDGLAFASAVARLAPRLRQRQQEEGIARAHPPRLLQQRAGAREIAPLHRVHAKAEDRFGVPWIASPHLLPDGFRLTPSAGIGGRLGLPCKLGNVFRHHPQACLEQQARSIAKRSKRNGGPQGSAALDGPVG